MDDRLVTHGNETSDHGRQLIGHVDHGAILNIGLRPEDHVRHITAEHRLVPYTGFGTDLDVGHHRGTGRNVGVRGDAGCGADVPGDGLGKPLHGTECLAAHAPNGLFPMTGVKPKTAKIAPGTLGD